MDLWIRSTAKTNLLRARFLTVMKGSTFYKKSEWEYDCYTICNVADNGFYELLGTYKTKKRALEILDEIQGLFIKQEPLTTIVSRNGFQLVSAQPISAVYNMPKE